MGEFLGTLVMWGGIIFLAWFMDDFINLYKKAKK